MISTGHTPIHESLTLEMVDSDDAYDLSVDVVMHPRALEGDGPLTVLMAGYGEERGAVSLGVERYGRLGIAAIAPVITFDNPRHIEHDMRNAPLAIADYYNDAAGRQQNSPVDAIGKSLGGAVILRSAASAPHRYSSLALHSPAGLTNEMLGDTPEVREGRFVRRLVIDNRLLLDQNPLLDPGNMTAWNEGEQRAAADNRSGLAAAKLACILNLELGSDLQAVVAAERPVRVFAGATDPVFRLQEYRTVLTALGLMNNLVEMPGSHTFLGSAACYRQQEAIAGWMHQQHRKVAAA